MGATDRTPGASEVSRERYIAFEGTRAGEVPGRGEVTHRGRLCERGEGRGSNGAGQERGRQRCCGFVFFDLCMVLVYLKIWRCVFESCYQG